MKTLKNLSFKNRLAVSYSLVLALMLISAAIFYHTSYRHLQRGLNSQAKSSLSSSIRQTDDLLKQIHAASLQLSSSSLFKTLADSGDPKDAAFSYTAWQVQEQLGLILPPEQLIAGGQLFVYLEKSGYILSSNYFSELSLAQKYNSQYQGLFQYSLSDDLMNPNNWRRFISLNDGESYLYICPVNNSLISLS